VQELQPAPHRNLTHCPTQGSAGDLGDTFWAEGRRSNQSSHSGTSPRCPPASAPTSYTQLNTGNSLEKSPKRTFSGKGKWVNSALQSPGVPGFLENSPLPDTPAGPSSSATPSPLRCAASSSRGQILAVVSQGMSPPALSQQGQRVEVPRGHRVPHPQESAAKSCFLCCTLLQIRDVSMGTMGGGCSQGLNPRCQKHGHWQNNSFWCEGCFWLADSSNALQLCF